MARQAIIVGSNGPLTNRLEFAEEDARRISRILASPRCGFKVDLIEKPTQRGAVMDDIAKILGRAVKEDTIILYFSGHGVIKNRGNLYLLLSTTTDQDFHSTTLPARYLMDLMSDCAARQKLFILDCCNAGTLATSLGLKGEKVPAEAAGIEPENHYILMASGHLEPARELREFKGSFLTSKICEALEECFDEADEDGDRTLSLDDLSDWVEKEAVYHNNIDKNHPVPIPRVFGMGYGPLYLTWGPAEWVTYNIPTVTWSNETKMVILPVLHDAEHAFCMGWFPVTNAQYRRFVEATGHREPVGSNFEMGEWRESFQPWHDPRFNVDDQPVVCVSYEDARAYREWVSSLNPEIAGIKSAEYGLPPPQLWDFAAFGKQHPSWDPKTYMSLAKYHDDSDRPAGGANAADRRNKFGLADMMGNVWEWCGGTDERMDEYMKAYAIELRGGSYKSKLARTRPYLRAAEVRDETHARLSDIGFRISGLIPLSAIPEEVRHRVAAMPVIEFESFHLEPAREVREFKG